MCYGFMCFFVLIYSFFLFYCSFIMRFPPIAFIQIGLSPTLLLEYVEYRPHSEWKGLRFVNNDQLSFRQWWTVWHWHRWIGKTLCKCFKWNEWRANHGRMHWNNKYTNTIRTIWPCINEYVMLHWFSYKS